MREFFIKILIKLTRINVSEKLGIVDKDKLNKWLYVSYKDEGWKQYYTLRKKSLLQLLGLGIEDKKEYWQVVGRLKELQSLSSNINHELNRRKKAQEKEREDKG